MIPLEGEGTTGVRRLERRARGRDLGQLESGGEERREEGVRDIHGVRKKRGEGRRGEEGAEERDGGTEMEAVLRLEEEQGAWGLLWRAEERK